MKKILLGLLAAVATLIVAGVISVAVIFRVQYQAASSVHEVTEGMYEFTYEGDYGFDQLLEQGGVRNSMDVAVFATSFLTHGALKLKVESNDFGCSSFAAMGDDGNYRVGRNFDWQSDAGNVVIVHTHPEEGYSSVSTFLIDFLGFGEGWQPVSMEQKFMLEATVYTPLDGMNEKGLYVADLMAGDDEVTHQEDNGANVTTTAAIRLLLDRAATTDEAIALLRAHNMHSDIGMAHHLAISDAVGHSVVAEWVNNQLFVVESPICTNHYLAESPKQSVENDENDSWVRYNRLQQHIAEHPQMSAEDAVRTLASVADTCSTRWSIVYDRTQMTATYFQRGDFDHPYVTNILR